MFRKKVKRHVSSLTDIDQKALSAKIQLSKMIHTGSVAEVQDKKRLANHRNLLEGFSICPVYTGMNLTSCAACYIFPNLPRMHGAEPFPDGFVVGVDAFEPRTCGDEPSCSGMQGFSNGSAPYARG